MAEAYALKEGLMLAQYIGCNKFIIQTDCMQVVETMKDGCNKFIIQTDCMQVVETMKDGGFSATAAIAIYDDCILLWSGFDSICIEHCNRGCV